MYIGYVCISCIFYAACMSICHSSQNQQVMSPWGLVLYSVSDCIKSLFIVEICCFTILKFSLSLETITDYVHILYGTSGFIRMVSKPEKLSFIHPLILIVGLLISFSMIFSMDFPMKWPAVVTIVVSHGWMTSPWRHWNHG